MMADLGAGIHTVGPGMKSLSHGSLGLFLQGGVLQGDPGGRQLTEAELSASVNELPQHWLADLTHSQCGNQPNPTLKPLFYTHLKTCGLSTVVP